MPSPTLSVRTRRRLCCSPIVAMLLVSDEVGLGVDLDRRAPPARDGDADKALGGGASGLLGGGRKPLGAQPVDRGFHVAAGLAERLLAVHHPGARAVAQLLDGGSGDLRHFNILSKECDGR